MRMPKLSIAREILAEEWNLPADLTLRQIREMPRDEIREMLIAGGGRTNYLGESDSLTWDWARPRGNRSQDDLSGV